MNALLMLLCNQVTEATACTCLQVQGKVNAISVDSCQRTGVLFDSLVAACEVVNSTKIQLQATGVVPTIAVDKCDGVQVLSAHISCITRPLQ
jgi:adenylyl cyclase-associated protein